MLGEMLILLLILGAVFVIILMTTIVQVEQYETVVALRLGKFNAMLNPGWNFVVPFITQLFKVDNRDQILQVPCQEIITKDNSRIVLDAVIHYRVADGRKAVLNVVNYKVAMIDFSMFSLRSSVEDKDLHEIFSEQNGKMSSVEVLLLKELSIQAKTIGIKINNVEIREADFLHDVDAVVVEQNMANREQHEVIFNIGWKRSLLNFVTQRSLRSFFSVSTYSSEIRKTSSIVYKLFTLIFLIVSILMLSLLIWVPFNLEVDGVKLFLEEVPYFLMLFYIFFYSPVILLFHWPHTNWTRRVAETRLVTKETEARVRETEVRKKDKTGTTLRDLYVLRADALGAQQQGMDVSEIIEAINILDNKFLEEAKQNISIEEIAKLQEEFVNSLDKENAA